MVDRIINELLSTPLAYGEHKQFMELNHPQLFLNETLAGDTVKKVYSLDNGELRSLLSTLYKQDASTLYGIHEIHYHKGSSCIEHLDVRSAVTCLLILDDNFEGGAAMIGGKDANLYKKGDHIAFDGNRVEHGVQQITKGCRKVLVTWFNSPRSLV